MREIDYERLVKWYGDRNIKTLLYASSDLQSALAYHNRKNIISTLGMIEAIVIRYSELYGIHDQVCDMANETNEFEYQEILDRYSPRMEKMREARFDANE